MQIIKISVGDRLIMKKKHPCGSDSFTVLRIGSDIRIVCNGCARDITLERTELEKKIKRTVKFEENDI